jgi:hypothetical protein
MNAPIDEAHAISVTLTAKIRRRVMRLKAQAAAWDLRPMPDTYMKGRKK